MAPGAGGGPGLTLPPRVEECWGPALQQQQTEPDSFRGGGLSLAMRKLGHPCAFVFWAREHPQD